MPESILDASRKARSHGLGFFKKKSVWIVLFVLAASGGGWYYATAQKNKQTANVVKPKEAVVQKGDLKIAIDSNGKVVAKDGADLSFSVSADALEVTKVYVKEGQKIKKGDKIAEVKADDLEMGVQTAYANYQSTLASYNEKMDGMTASDAVKAQNSIKQAELSLSQAKDSLARTKANSNRSIADAQEKVDTAKTNLATDFKETYQNAIDKSYSDILTNLKSTVIGLDSLLKDSDGILGIDNKYINDSFESFLGAKNVDTLSKANGSYLAAKNSFDSLQAEVSMLSLGQSAGMEKAANDALATLSLFESHFDDMQALLANTITGPTFSQSALNAFVATVNSDRANIVSKTSSLNNALNSLNDAKDSLQSYTADYNKSQSDLNKAYQDALTNLANVKDSTARDIKDAESNIANKQLALTEANQNYEDLKKPLSAADLASAKSQLTNAAVNLQKAKNDLESAVLKSPIDGEVSQLNYKAGDTILKSSAKTFVSIVNNDTLFVEANVEEADVSKLKIGQKAVASFDALDGEKIEGEVSFISLTSQTSSNGIVTYLVRVLFENASGKNVREGMTANVEFVTASADNVLYVPVDSVRNVNGSPSVETADGKWAVVTTGFTDGTNVEIISGLDQGQRITY